MRWHELDSSDSGQGKVAGSCEQMNEVLGSDKMWTISGLAEGPVASQEGLCYAILNGTSQM
jgi:hypothetical protein